VEKKTKKRLFSCTFKRYDWDSIFIYLTNKEVRMSTTTMDRLNTMGLKKTNLNNALNSNITSGLSLGRQFEQGIRSLAAAGTDAVLGTLSIQQELFGFVEQCGIKLSSISALVDVQVQTFQDGFGMSHSDVAKNQLTQLLTQCESLSQEMVYGLNLCVQYGVSDVVLRQHYSLCLRVCAVISELLSSCGTRVKGLNISAHLEGLGQSKNALSISTWQGTGSGPLASVWEKNDAFIATVELPGVRLEDIDVEVQQGILIIRGEKICTFLDDGLFCHQAEQRFGSFIKRVTLGTASVAIDHKRIEAKLIDGVLFVTAFKKTAPSEEFARVNVQKTIARKKG
jgi:HSP20 family protein